MLICIIIGVLISLITVMVLKGQLNSVYSQDGAQAYVTADSLDLQVRTDQYLYENTTRTPKPRSDNKK